jgi:23S rRNA pseudouridine2605 synthase
MEERIQKIISAAGVASRRAAEELIAEGRVRVNGQVVTELGTKADASKDHIKVDGKLINPHQPKTYIMLNKPVGFVTTMSDPEGRPTVQDLLKGVKVRVYPVGRLDYNTEGMLIMTNDGDFAFQVTHPKHELPKTYLAKLKGVLDEKQIEMIETGLFLDDGKTAPAKLRKIRKEEANSWVELTITEGRKRQVRRMFDRVGRSVIKLKRTKTGNLVLGDLPEGTFRYLTPIEVKGLMDLSQKTEVKPPQPASLRKPAVLRKEGPAAGVTGIGSRSPRPEYRGQGTTGRGRDERQPKKYEARTRPTASMVMQDTTDGRRKNQIFKPRPVDEPAVASGRTTRPGVVRQREDSERGTATGAAVRKTAPASTGNRETRRVPAQRSWASTKSSEARSRGSRYETQEEGRRPASGSRPNRGAFAGSRGPGGAAGFGTRGDSTYRPASRPASSRPATTASTGRSAPAAAMGRPEVTRKPDQRPWPSTRKSGPGSKGPGVVSGYGPRKDSGARPATRSDTSRPTTRPGFDRPAPGAVSGRPETRRKPAPRSWPGSKSGDSRGKGAGYEGRSEGKWQSSGPRPNKSTHTGGKGPRRVNRPAGSRGPGQGASNRGPRR